MFSAWYQLVRSLRLPMYQLNAIRRWRNDCRPTRQRLAQRSFHQNGSNARILPCRIDSSNSSNASGDIWVAHSLPTLGCSLLSRVWNFVVVACLLEDFIVFFFLTRPDCRDFAIYSCIIVKNTYTSLPKWVAITMMDNNLLVPLPSRTSIVRQKNATRTLEPVIFAWTIDQTRQFIKMIESSPSVWNFQNVYYSNNSKRQATWESIGNALDVKRSVQDCKAKWKNLKTTYYNIKRKLEKQTRLSSWPFYRDMHFIQENESNEDMNLVWEPKWLTFWL